MARDFFAHESDLSSETNVVLTDALGHLVIPDASLMFQGAYHRSGSDLGITGADGHKVLIPEYFAHEHPPALLSPSGAMLSGELVAQLAGPRFPGQYAQVGTPVKPTAIGQVETFNGSIIVTHADGTKSGVGIGTPVYQGDILETGVSSKLAITFADKTELSLGDSARMVLDKFAYDPASSSNASLFKLVHGSFVFMAGFIAPSGSMRIETPVATMGIRGTTGVVHADVDNGTSYFTLKPDPPGKLGQAGGNIGAFDVFALTDGRLIKAVREADQLLVVRNSSGLFEEVPQLPANEVAFQQQIVAFAFAAYSLMVQRVEGGQPPVQPDDRMPLAPPAPPGQRGDINQPSTQLASADGHSSANTAGNFHDPNNFDPLNPNNVTLLTGESRGGFDPSGLAKFPGAGDDHPVSASLSLPPLVTTPAVPGQPTFSTNPIALAFLQAPASDGIHNYGPFTFTSPNAGPVNATITLATVTTVSLSFGGAAPIPFTLTPTQADAFAHAFTLGSWHYNLNIDTTFLAQGEQVVSTFTVEITDASGQHATQVETFTVVGVDDAPTVAAPLMADLLPGASLDLLQGAHDIDNGSSLHVANVVIPTGAPLEFDPGTHTIKVDPTSASFIELAQGEKVDYTATYDVLDEFGAKVSQTVTVTVTGINDAPTVSAPLAAGVSLGHSLDLLQGAHDVDHGAVLSVVGLSIPVGTPLVLGEDGHTLRLDPMSEAYLDLPAGHSATYTLSYLVADEHGASVHQTAMVTVTGVAQANSPPTFDTTDGFTGPFNLAGTATGPADGGTYTLIPGQFNTAGAIWQAVDLTQNAHWDAKLYFGPGGMYPFGPFTSDGITFAFQHTDANAIGGTGGALGIAQNISGPQIPDAVGVKFDTFPLNPGEPGHDFAQFFDHGDPNNTADYPNQVATGSLANGMFHSVAIDWNASTHTLSYSLDGGAHTDQIVRDIVGSDFGGQSIVYAGFTGAGGAAYALTQVEIDGISNGTTGLIAERPGDTHSTESRTTTGTLGFSDVNLADTHTITYASSEGNLYGTFEAHKVTDSSTTGHGSIAWSFTVADGALDELAAGQSVTQTYTVNVSDGLATASQDVTITLTGANDTPFVSDSAGNPSSAFVVATGPNDPAYLSSPSTDPASTSGTFFFGDPDHIPVPDAHNVTVFGTDYLGSLMINSVTDMTGPTSPGLVSWTYTVPNASSLDVLTAHEMLSEQYYFQITDQNGGLATAHLDIQLNGAPHFHVPGTIDLDAIAAGTVPGISAVTLATDPNSLGGFPVGGGGDINGDGLADVAVKQIAPFGEGSLSSDTGVIFGSNDFGSLPSTTINVAAGGDLIGSNGFTFSATGENSYYTGGVTTAGDYNGDGIKDLLVGVDQAGFAQGNVAYVRFGGPPLTDPYSNFGAIQSTDALPGLNLHGSTPDGHFAASVANSGDFNGDGIDDIAIGAPGENGGNGVTYVYFGTHGGTDLSPLDVTLDGSQTPLSYLSITGSSPLSGSGFSVAGAGDFNNDGTSSIVIGAPFADGNPLNPGDLNPVAAGEVYVVFGHGQFGNINSADLDGSNGFTITNSPGAPDYSSFGYSVAGGGDFNGDGIPDVLIGAPGNGAAYVVFGGQSYGASNSIGDLVTSGQAVQLLEAPGIVSGSFGKSVAFIGDVNGDGYGDVAIGSPNAHDGAGAVDVFYGKPGGISLDASQFQSDPRTGFELTSSTVTGLGVSVAAAGDVNGDGFADFIVGSTGGTSYLVLGGNLNGMVDRVGTSGADQLSDVSNTLGSSYLPTQGTQGFNIVAGAGSDVITAVGNAGTDGALYGGAGNDEIDLQLPNNGHPLPTIDGGSGTNTLQLYGNFDLIDLTQAPSLQIQNIQELNLTQGLSQTLRLSVADVFDLTQSADANLVAAVGAYNGTHEGNPITISLNHAIVIDGDHGDLANLAVDTVDFVATSANVQSGSWVNAGTVAVNTQTNGTSDHEVFNYVSQGEVVATVAVQHDVHVQVPGSVGA